MREARGQRKQNAVLLGMSTTPGLGDLPFVEKEITELRPLLAPSIPAKVLINPTKEEVVPELTSHEIVHLAVCILRRSILENSIYTPSIIPCYVIG
jgi:hypothetical protein